MILCKIKYNKTNKGHYLHDLCNRKDIMVMIIIRYFVKKKEYYEIKLVKWSVG